VSIWPREPCSPWSRSGQSGRHQTSSRRCLRRPSRVTSRRGRRLGAHADVVQAMVMRLFPAGQRHIGGTHYGGDWTRRWLRERRIAHEQILRLYLERVAGKGLQAFRDAERASAVMPDRDALDSYARLTRIASRTSSHRWRRTRTSLQRSMSFQGRSCFLTSCPIYQSGHGGCSTSIQG
jgi:hypothetical protein